MRGSAWSPMAIRRVLAGFVCLRAAHGFPESLFSPFQCLLLRDRYVRTSFLSFPVVPGVPQWGLDYFDYGF